MGKTYAQLHTPDGSKSELYSNNTRKHEHTPNVVARESMTDLEEASDSTDTVVYAKDDKLGCGGMMGRCPLIVLFLFVALGVLIGVGASTLLVCRRYVAPRYTTLRELLDALYGFCFGAFLLRLICSFVPNFS